MLCIPFFDLSFFKKSRGVDMIDDIRRKKKLIDRHMGITKKAKKKK